MVSGTWEILCQARRLLLSPVSSQIQWYAWLVFALTVAVTWDGSPLSHLTAYGKLRIPSDSLNQVNETVLHRWYRRFTDWTCPKRLFVHFYVVGFVIQLVLVVIQIGCSVHGVPSSFAANTLLGVHVPAVLYFIHVGRRLAENLWVHSFGNARMHVLGYVVGVGYYVVAPATVTAMGGVGVLTTRNATETAGSEDKIGAGQFCPWLWLGVGSLIWLLGNCIQADAHLRLASLRNKKTRAGRSQYHLPRGGGFEWVSSPHYFGEIVVYIGLLIGCVGSRLLGEGAGSPPVIPTEASAADWLSVSFMMMLWVVGNLSATALRTHSWYKDKFKDYPPERYALFPKLL